MNNEIILKLDSDVKYFADLLKKVRKVLKAPRLYWIFWELIDKFEANEIKNGMIMNNLLKENRENLEINEFEAV